MGLRSENIVFLFLIQKYFIGFNLFALFKSFFVHKYWGNAIYDLLLMLHLHTKTFSRRHLCMFKDLLKIIMQAVGIHSHCSFTVHYYCMCIIQYIDNKCIARVQESGNYLFDLFSFFRDFVIHSLLRCVITYVQIYSINGRLNDNQKIRKRLSVI